MTKHEFLSKLAIELNKNNVADANDVVGEYEQHFAFKMADGFSEEEIAAKLGDPTLLASQFERGSDTPKWGGKKLVTILGLCFSDLFAGMFFVLMIAWGIVMAVFVLACGVSALCLLSGLNVHSLIPPMPYGCGVVFGVSLAALALLTAVGFLYFSAFLRQLMRSFGRFHHNTMAAASGGVVLPSLAIHPQLTPKTNRRMRLVALTALAVFAAGLLLGMILSMLSAGSFSFWHAWGWFGYTGVSGF